MKVDLERYAKINHFKTIRENMKYLKLSVGFLVFLLAMQVEAKETLKKDDPKVISLCDKNGDNKIKGKEYLCYLDLKKKRANDGLERANDGLERANDGLERAKNKGNELDKDITGLDKDINGLDKDINGLDKDIKKLRIIKNLLKNK